MSFRLERRYGGIRRMRGDVSSLKAYVEDFLHIPSDNARRGTNGNHLGLFQVVGEVFHLCDMLRGILVVARIVQWPALVKFDELVLQNEIAKMVKCQIPTHHHCGAKSPVSKTGERFIKKGALREIGHLLRQIG